METTIAAKNIAIEVVQFGNEDFFKISNYDAMRPFFMSIVSSSDHWMFISSNGGLTAGRRNAEFSLFPYYTDDKITESAEVTGSKSIFLVRQVSGGQALWEPFSDRFDGKYQITRNLYKNKYGNKLLFEEINHDLEVSFRYQWNSGDTFGFIKTSTLINNSNSEVEISALDGIQNILPYGVESYTQNNSSNLVDAYKRSELDRDTGLGIYALSAIIVDKAEPSEALKANVAWSAGLDHPNYLLSSLQLKDFRQKKQIKGETDVKAEKGAYFIHADLLLAPREEKEWMIVADVNKNHASVARIRQTIKTTEDLPTLLKEDIKRCTKDLVNLNAASDALQVSSDHLRDSRHFSNTLFNIMRGGIFDDNYKIEKKDFSTYLANANKEVFQNATSVLNDLPEEFSLSHLKQLAYQNDDTHFCRLCLEYMPLKFSRRHGDPSRPWNKFSINTRSLVDGSKILDYEGNWRDIFQNWEALVYSYPDFIESMIHKFLNATTFDGYNPYRVTKGGFDWETIEPDDPWSYIGYWGDHQIIYLLKLLEFQEEVAPGTLEKLFDKDLFVYANVPYIIKSYEDTLKNPKDTIDFNEHSDAKIREERDRLGADGALLKNQQGNICQVNFIEKILATVLAKLSNFIPEGGIWMNTQRPEWNDANNALVGNGVSMVTLYYLRRFLNFFDEVFEKADTKEVQVSSELYDFYQKLLQAFKKHNDLLSGPINDTDRKSVLDDLGSAGSDYRMHIYQNDFSGNKRTLALDQLKNFVNLAQKHLEHSITANKRTDNLYHAYNLMTVSSDTEVSISYLSEMLEGQVAVLSAGYLSSMEVIEVLDGMKQSQLFREDQYSYLLYPNKNLAGFLERNNIPAASVAKSSLLTQLVEADNHQVIEKDLYGDYHFNGNFKNANDVKAALDELGTTSYADAVSADEKLVLQIFEEVFNHKAFTGRSGTFYGYEGLGSIYWHMVSKLRLAVQECCLKAVAENASAEIVGRLLEHYYEIDAGIGVHKSPQLYGAFPTDPYSHTPAGKGAQQPGMTGQVKEDILSRFGELGVFVKDGKLQFDPCLLRKSEFLAEPVTFEYVDIHSNSKKIDLEAGSLAFTYCQIPVMYHIEDEAKVIVVRADGSAVIHEGKSLDEATSRQVFERTGTLSQIDVWVEKSLLQ
ncbi:MAG: hypothetical protein AAFO07_03555 [Bacteroidota bacterium]